MAKGVNKAILVGRLGRDPETRQFQGGGQVTNVSIATEETWRDKQTGEQQSRTEWHRLVFFARLSEIADQYLRKGDLVYVEGQLTTRKWQGQDGQDRYTTEIRVRDLQMLGSPNRDGGGARRGGGGGDSGSGGWSGGGGGGGQRTQQQAPVDDFDDDIPF